MYNREPKFFVTPCGDVSSIGKVGSSSVAHAIMRDHYPDNHPTFAGRDPREDAGWWQMAVPKHTLKEAVNPVVLVRDPVERFRSACAQVGKTPSEVFHSIEEDGFFGLTNFHFRPVVDWMVEGAKFLRFPDELGKLQELLKLNDLTHLNKQIEKPELTPEEIEKIREIYAEDERIHHDS